MKSLALSWIRMPLLLAVVIGVVVAFPERALTASDLLYDVDFGSPPHTVGLPPVTGAGASPRDTVSSINFGTPIVVASFGSLADQPLEFDSFDGQGDQIQLDLSDLPPQTSYTMEADLVIAAVDDFFRPFTILLDTPQVRTVSFRADGTVTHFVPGVSLGTIGSFTFGSQIHLRIEVDLTADSWQIFLNSVSVHAGGFGSATEIRAVRFSTDVLSPPGGASAAIDNVRIFSVVPGPTAIDIKPGSETNPISLRGRGVIPVAILTTDTFDATTVDPDTVCFGDVDEPAERDCSEAHGRGHIADVDGDGDLDLLLHFETRETGIDPGDTEACLTGETFDGTPIAACDSVRIL